MRTLKRSVAAFPSVVVVGIAAAGTASAQLDYTGPLHLRLESSQLVVNNGLDAVCRDGGIEGSITDGGFPAHADISEMSFLTCLAFEVINCQVIVNDPLELHGSAETADTVELHIESSVELSRSCTWAGTCHFDAAPNTIEGAFSEASNTLEFNNQPLSGFGGCGTALWTASYHLTTPNELHW